MSSDTEPTVFIVNFAGHNYEPAESFGSLRVLTEGYVDLSRPDRLIYDTVKALQDSSPDDYILPSGALILNIIVACVFLTLHNKVTLLAWTGGKYQRFTIRDKDIGWLTKQLTQGLDADVIAGYAHQWKDEDD